MLFLDDQLHFLESELQANPWARGSSVIAPAVRSTGMADGGSGDADATNSRPTWAASETNSTPLDVFFFGSNLFLGDGRFNKPPERQRVKAIRIRC